MKQNGRWLDELFGLIEILYKVAQSMNKMLFYSFLACFFCVSFECSVPGCTVRLYTDLTYNSLVIITFVCLYAIRLVSMCIVPL
jgi:hypothetical protein